jgi:hypothetical protein
MPICPGSRTAGRPSAASAAAMRSLPSIMAGG